MNLRDYERMLRTAEEKYKADVAAIERVWAMVQTASGTGESGARPDGLAELVNSAIHESEGLFTKKTIMSRLRAADPSIPQSSQNAIGGILKRMNEAGEISMLRPGKGKRATEYVRKSSTNGSEHIKPLSLTDDEVPSSAE